MLTRCRPAGFTGPAQSSMASTAQQTAGKLITEKEVPAAVLPEKQTSQPRCQQISQAKASLKRDTKQMTIWLPAPWVAGIDAVGDEAGWQRDQAAQPSGLFTWAAEQPVMARHQTR